MVLSEVSFVTMVTCIVAQTANDVIVSRGPFTWIRGLEVCRHENDRPMSMVGRFIIGHNDVVYNEVVKQAKGETVWLYGIVVIVSAVDWYHAVEIGSAEQNSKLGCICQKDTSFTIDGGAEKTFTEARSNCSLLRVGSVAGIIQPTGRGDLNSTYWIEVSDVSNLLGDTASTRCLLLDIDGAVKTDDCNNTHKTACVSGVFKDTLYYQEFKRYPDYMETTTSVTTESTLVTGSTPGTATTDMGIGTATTSREQNDTNSTNITQGTPATVYPPALGMTPEIVYALIGVGCVIGLVVLSIICFCCCVKRDSKNRAEKENVQLAEVYSDAVDSIVFKEADNDPTAKDTVEYATPEDALPHRRVVSRNSLKDNEYDTVNANRTMPTGNVYSHVTIKSSQSDTKENENVYDVTSNTLQKLKASEKRKVDVQDNLYSHLDPRKPKE